MPFGKSTLVAPVGAEAVAASKWASMEGVRCPALARACPAASKESVLEAVEALRTSRGDAAETFSVVCGTTSRPSAAWAGSSVRCRRITVTADPAAARVSLDADSVHEAVYGVAPKAGAGLWARDAEEAAALVAEDGESGAGAAFRESRSCPLRPAGLVVAFPKDWADPTGEKAAAARADAAAAKKAAAAHGGALPAGLFSGKSKAPPAKKKKATNANMGTFFSGGDGKSGGGGGGGAKKKMADRSPKKNSEPKKRRVIDDDEEDDDEAAEDAAMEAAERAAAPPLPEVEETRAGKKLVEQTFVDDGGYLVSRQVWVADDGGDDNAKPALTVTAAKPKAKAPAPPPKAGLPKPKPKTAPKLKKGQTSMASFFGAKKK